LPNDNSSDGPADVCWVFIYTTNPEASERRRTHSLEQNTVQIPVSADRAASLTYAIIYTGSMKRRRHWNWPEKGNIRAK